MIESDKILFRHRNLEVWKLGCDLLEHVYDLLRMFPPEERFALADQLRRAAVSVPSNIAEGAGRRSAADFIHFLVMARGSLAEIDTQLFIAVRRGYLPDTKAVDELLVTLGYKLNALIASIDRRASS